MTDRGQDAQDLADLVPERVVSIAGRAVTVRPFGFIEGIRLRPIVAPIVASLEAVAADPDAAGVDEMEALFSSNEAELVSLIAISSGLSEDDVRGLSDDDGQALLLAFWLVNKDFFLRRLMQRAVIQRARSARPS